MNSSMLAGERRWASARRGGMTVLGKVAVPKPLNLPSQRLENHGLDPNVEIVPKGTLGWGSRPSSSGSNPWASSSLSPNAEGGTGSPNHLSGRPSSGGNGTRPSTAGSERAHEPVSGGAWGSNSRPSSASGTLSSNQTSSASVRPSSAENRPNSSQSQLSRFADPVSKNSAAWSPNVTGERLGVKSSKEDGFSLTSGDFPTLGTEKDNSMKITEFEDHGRPSSSSGRISHEKDDTRDQADPKHGIVNTWRADGPQGPEDDIHPVMENWHSDNPQYFNRNAPPQHFDTWRGPPMNGPPGVWYGDRARGPPIGPGGFPMEPFPYYRPQIVPPHGTRGSHPKNGDLYRPQMPDAAYPRPGMSFRPGFYPRPMGFESFYGPPMGYERDMPYMRMPSPPTVYNNSYPPDIGNSHRRDGRDFHGGKASLEQVEAKDTQGPKRITLKSRNQCDQWKEGESREHNLQQPGVSYSEKSRLPIMSSRKNEWGAEEDLEDDVHALPLEMPSVPLYSGRDPSLPNVMKNSDLMQKIDGLNAKICVSDWRNDSLDASDREEVRNMSEITDMRINNKNREASNSVGSFEGTPASRDFVSVSDKPIQPMIVMSRRPRHGGQVIVDHRGKGKLNSQDADAWRKKPLSTESSNVMMASHNEAPTSFHPHGPNNVEESSENSVACPVAKVEGDSVETHDSIDIQSQRTKMREIAKQRILQLQKEEEERTKEQRAKALAKLEELNRRTIAGEAGTERSEKSQVINDIQGEPDESPVIDGPSMANHTNANQGEAVEEMPRNLPVESDVTTNLPVQEDAHDVGVRKSPPQYNDSRHKRAGYKQKQRSFTEKYVPNVAANSDVTSGEHYPSSETTLSESNVPNVSDAVVERPVSQRRKSNKSSKNKHKPDEIETKTALHTVEFSESIENAETMDSRHVSGVIEPNKAVKDQQVLPKEESHSSKVSSQSRSQSSRRQPRSQQVNNKPHVGGDTAVWAPVNKAKVSVETSPDAVPESTNLTKGNNNNNSLKGKRAEMERYVPKPVAKELAQQVYSPNLSVTSSRLNDGPSKEANERDMDIISRNRHRKDQGAWKHRGPPDSSHTKGPDVEIQSNFDLVNAEIRTSVKDQGATNKGKRNTAKGGNNNNNNNKMDGEEGFADANQSIGPKENQASSHWQPKSSGTESLTLEGNMFPKKEHKARGGSFNQTRAGQSVNVGQEYEKEKDPVGPGEDVHHDRNIQSGSRRNNRQNNRHEPRGDWAPGNDKRPFNGPPFRDNRQSQNLQHEYQHGAGDGMGQRHRERGPVQRRGGGNFNRRQSGATAAPANVDSGWE